MKDSVDFHVKEYYLNSAAHKMNNSYKFLSNKMLPMILSFGFLHSPWCCKTREAKNINDMANLRIKLRNNAPLVGIFYHCIVSLFDCNYTAPHVLCIMSTKVTTPFTIHSLIILPFLLVPWHFFHIFYSMCAFFFYFYSLFLILYIYKENHINN